MNEDLVLTAALHRMTRDNENEVTITFKVPATEYISAVAIPAGKELTLKITIKE